MRSNESNDIERVKLKCKWCQFESDNIEDFEEDFNYHKGYWCCNCEGFTYFSGKEEYQQNSLYLEDAAKVDSIKYNGYKKFNKRLSPLRYPGGKSKWIPFIAEQLDANKKTFIEPFCGGSSVGLSLLEKGLVKSIVLNDLDFGVYSLFKTICDNPSYLIENIKKYVPSRESFFEYRNLIKTSYKGLKSEEAAFVLLIVNRLSFSGIYKANPKGKLEERYNPKALIKRIEWIHSRRENIIVLNEDACNVIEEYYWSSDATLFIDPPYYKKGVQLYPLYFVDEQHEALAQLINELYCSYPGCANILITYDC